MWGSDTRLDVTFIGSPLTEAARMESRWKEVGVDLIMGRRTALRSDQIRKEREPIKVKGVERPLQSYGLFEE